MVSEYAMKRSIRFGKLWLVLPLFAAAVPFWAGPAQATKSYYWDINSSVAGAGGATPSDRWDSGNLYWNPSSEGTSTCIPYENNSFEVFFSAGADATGNYTITVCGTRNANKITVKDGTPKFVGESGNSKLFLFDTGTIDTTTCNPLFNVVIGGSVGLTKTGSGTLTLSGTNIYSGLTTINVGTLQVGSGGTSGLVPGDIANYGALVFNRSDNPIYGGAISGSGTVTKNGAGVLTLQGANTYAGATTVNAGTLKLVGTNAVLNAWDPVLNRGGSDIQGGKMVFDYTTDGTTPASLIKGLLTTSYDASGQKRFDTGKFKSTTADASHGLGWIDDTTSKQVKVAYTF